MRSAISELLYPGSLTIETSFAATAGTGKMPRSFPTVAARDADALASASSSSKSANHIRSISENCITSLFLLPSLRPDREKIEANGDLSDLFIPLEDRVTNPLVNEIRIVRLWAACAWADEKMHPAELAALKRCIEAQELSGAEATEAQSLLERPGELDLAEVRKLDASSREGVYRAALAIVRIDREVSEQELSFLANLRDNLELDASTIEGIEAEGNGLVVKPRL